MSSGPKGKVIAVLPSDASAKTTDVVEEIISCILEAGEVDVVGVEDGIFLACSAVNMASEIAKVYVEDIYIGSLKTTAVNKASAIAVHLGQKQIGDYAHSSRTRGKGI